MDGAIISEKPLRDLGDRKQNWVLLYEDRTGGYIGRLSTVASTTEDYELLDAGLFTEQLAQASTLGQTGPQQLSPVWGPPQTQRYIWPLAMNPSHDRIIVKWSDIRRVVHMAALPALLRRMWDQQLAQYDELKSNILREIAAGGAPQIAIARDLPKIK